VSTGAPFMRKPAHWKLEFRLLRTNAPVEALALPR